MDILNEVEIASNVKDIEERINGIWNRIGSRDY